MLMISRRAGERILIGEGDELVEIVVVETRRGSVRFGIEAPKGMLVLRAEVADRRAPADAEPTSK